MVPFASLLSACLAVGVAAWLVPATIHIVNWGSDGAGRVALFAPAFYLRWAISIAFCVAAGLWVLPPRHPDDRRRRACVLAPLSALWFWAVPFAPWVPDRLPLLLVLAGPVRWCIAIGALGAVLARSRVLTLWRLPELRLPGRRTVFALSLLLYLAAGYRSLHHIGIGGDEPHYLVIAQSLWLDGDLQIENNHQRGDYRQYFGGALRPDYLKRGQNGQIYSIHAPGLPLLVLPAFILAGAWGAIVMVAFSGALAALAVFEIAAVVGGPRAAWPTWASICLTVPFVPHAWAIFPEMPGAAIVAWGLLWTMREAQASGRAWLWRGICLAALPWLHTKFAVFLAVLTLMLVVRARRRLTDQALLTIPVGVSLIGWFVFFYVVYGTIDPQAPYGDYAAQFVRVENVPRSVLGALFDQKFGLFIYAPVFVAAAWGSLELWRDRRWRWQGLAAIGLAAFFTLSSARLYMWWGGSSAPARFLVPVVPLLAPALAVAFVRARGSIARAHLLGALLASLAITVLSIADMAPPLLFSNPHGVARLAEWLRAGSPLPFALPTFTEEDWLAPFGRLGLWGAPILVAAMIAWFFSGRLRRTSSSALFWPLLVEGVAFLMTAAIVVAPYSAQARAESVEHGRFGLIAAFDPDARRAFDYRRRSLSRLSPQEWLESSRLTFRLDPAESPDSQGRLTEGLTLPPGQYQLDVLFDESVPREGDLLAALGGGSVLATMPGPLPRLATMQLTMPIAVPQLWVQMSHPPSAASARRVDITPRSIVPRSKRTAADVQRIESVAGRQDAYMAYVNDAAFPEGGVFWTRGTGEASLLVAPAGAPTLKLTLHIGPNEGQVRVRVGERTFDVPMRAEETRVLLVPVPPGQTVLALSVRSPVSFRPADVVAGANDTRELGCQVRVEVE